MGTQNLRLELSRDLIDVESIRMNEQQKIDSKKEIEERRRRGQFATPIDLADEITAYGLSVLSTDDISFLEPAVGTGAFISALLRNCKDKYISKCIGYEIDKQYFDVASSLWSYHGFEMKNLDFTMQNPSGKQVNLLISNPPYVRHHYITVEEKTRLNKLVYNEVGINISGLAGLYSYFMLLSHKWLAPGAVSGWLIPSEFMDVNYGEALKEYLLNHVRLLRIHRYDPQNSQFNDALVSSAVVWFINEKCEDDYEVEFTFGGTHTLPQKRKLVRKSVLSLERKWTRFPEQDVRSTDMQRITQLGDYFDIKRGLATGDNNFFILTKEQIEERGLDMSFFIPILPSPRKLKTDEVLSDKMGIPQIDTPYFLLRCSLPEDEIKEKSPALWSYLQTGKDTTAKKYLCKSRRLWYMQENRTATPFLCSYMGRSSESRSPFRFILNHSDAVATNSYLMLYPKPGLERLIAENTALLNKVWDILCSIGNKSIENEGRVYGGGLKKIEPKELAKVPCQELDFLC